MTFSKNLYLMFLSLLFVFCTTNRKHPFQLKAKDFQTIIDGKKTDLFLLQNKETKVYITNYGGRIVSLLTPDKNGDMGDVVLGFNSIDNYLKANGKYHGSLIGRVGNRIAKGRFELNDTVYNLPKNNGENHLHGGPEGINNQVWDVKSIRDNSIVLSYTSEDGAMGYPGNLAMEVSYQLSESNGVIITYEATTDKSTPVNLTNHAFFNLAGEGNGTINDHLLTINADQFTPVDDSLIPLGQNTNVKDTPFDFRIEKAIGQDLNLQETDLQLTRGKGYDHNFVLNKTDVEESSLAATVVETKSGRKMEVFTEEPGMQFYGGNFFQSKDIGKYGKAFGYRESFALETQHYPDSPNQPNFPSIILNPGEVYSTKTIYKFSLAN